MDLATGAMGSLLPKLVELLKEEYRLQKGVKGDVEFLERELRSMHGALRKVGDVPRDQVDEQVKIWADDVRELSYGMEDVVDRFLVRVEGFEADASSHSLKQLVKKMGNLLTKGKTRHQIADEVKEIKVRVKEVADRRDRYRVDDVVANPAAATVVDPRLFALYKDHTEIVGIDGTRDEVTKKLIDEDDHMSKQHLKTLSIYGCGGLGKTTLAKAVYDRLSTQFNCNAFVSVGRNPDVKKVLKDILIELDKKYLSLSATPLDERQLIDELRGLLEDKRYFIVVDDIWDTPAWEIIRCGLVDNNQGSRVIITTRNFDVATIASCVYKLEPLSHANSEELFYTRLFGGKGKCPYDQPAGVPEKILQKCGGVPLAIITIASLLAGKAEKDWSKVYNSIGFGYGENKDVENTRKILLYSYYDLPYYLKTCLLYLSIFPEDEKIAKDNLIWKWVAEGFIHEVPGVGLFELGERYFNELINRSMIQPAGDPSFGSIFACRVHDMVLDMICSLSREENFITIYDGSERHISSHGLARRLAIQNRVIEQHDPLTNTRLAHVRSFCAIRCQFGMLAPLLLNFQVLRVLELQFCKIIEERHEYPLEHLCRLVQLRYLGFRRTKLSRLPKKIGDLKFLQTLNLELSYIKELPQSFVRLRQLKCLYLEGTSVEMPDCIDNLASLECLFYRVVGVSPNFVKELGKLTELRELRILFAEDLDERSMKALVESLGKLQKIQCLELRYRRSDKEESNCWESYVPPEQLRDLTVWTADSRLPRWINSSLLPVLSRLLVDVKVLEAVDVEILGKLPQLVSLLVRMPDHVATPIDVVIGNGAFPKLRYWDAPMPLGFLQGAMRSTEHMSLYYKVTDQIVPSFDYASLGNLPSLQKVLFYARYSGGATAAAHVVGVEAALRQALDNHPNLPILHFSTHDL